MLAVTVTSTPQGNVPAQLVLAQQTIPPANSLVQLFQSIPTTLAAIQASLPSTAMTVYTRQVCRGSYCVSCDGTQNCVPLVWVGVKQGALGKYAYNVSSVPADALVTFVVVTPGLCTPTISLQSEYVVGLVVAVSSISSATSVPLICPNNKLIGTNLSVTGTTSALNRRLLLMTSELLQTAFTADSVGVSIVCPQNLTRATQTALAGANLTIQGYSPVNKGDVFLVANATNNATLSCPANSTSPEGATSVYQCVCLPGYEGNAALGTPCSPCAVGVFCSGGLIGMCPRNASAPAMSNSSADCVCNPGFYGNAALFSCSVCPANSYCQGGTLSRPCTEDAVSPAQSSSPQACYCAPGYAGVGNAPCDLCSPGFWCWTGIINECPMNMTSELGASRSTDCFCADGYRSVATKSSNGNSATVCLLCSEDTYCKVRRPLQTVYNRAFCIRDDDFAHRFLHHDAPFDRGGIQLHQRPDAEPHHESVRQLHS